MQLPINVVSVRLMQCIFGLLHTHTHNTETTGENWSIQRPTIRTDDELKEEEEEDNHTIITV